MDASRSTPRAPKGQRCSTTCPGLETSGTRSSCSPRNVAVAVSRRRPRRPCRRIPAASSTPSRRPLALLGFMGLGKTLVGALVAERTKSTFFDVDHLVEHEAGMSIADLFATSGEQGFHTLEKRGLPRALQPGAVVALGGGVVMDDDNWALITGRATTVYLEVPFEMIWRRIGKSPSRPLISGRTASEVEAL